MTAASNMGYNKKSVNSYNEDEGTDNGLHTPQKAGSEESISYETNLSVGTIF
jgi:hypothetical protein